MKDSTQPPDEWLPALIERHSRLTNAAKGIVENVLRFNNVDYLSVIGRTKNIDSATEKIKRKGYDKPQEQLTDLSGIRVILFSESDVQRCATLIETAFTVDQRNSLDKASLLRIDQTGYRSVHFVCHLGDERTRLPEFSGLADLKFEIQVRTVLQHAWAELSHDRKYKFSGKLPRDLERQLFLYAGLLEIADRGFDELAKSIDRYAADVASELSGGGTEAELTSISMRQFINTWSKQNQVNVEGDTKTEPYAELLMELDQFGIRTVQQLRGIIPQNYVSASRKHKYETTVYGLVRDWMLATDWKRLRDKVKRNWAFIVDDDADFYKEIFGAANFSQIEIHFRH